LAVVPPGDAANSIKPTAKSGGKASILQIKNAIPTNKMSWQNNAIKTALGCLLTRAKSLSVSSSPIPAITMAKAIGKNIVINPESINRAFLNEFYFDK
jgi:hypothetical protein